MAPQDDLKVGAIRSRMTSAVDAVKLYTNYTKLSNVTLTSNELGATLPGFKFINPFDNYGFNNITANQDLLADGNGLLNRIGTYKTNPETGELEADKCTWYSMA